MQLGLWWAAAFVSPIHLFKWLTHESHLCSVWYNISSVIQMLLWNVPVRHTAGIRTSGHTVTLRMDVLYVEAVRHVFHWFVGETDSISRSRRFGAGFADVQSQRNGVVLCLRRSSVIRYTVVIPVCIDLLFTSRRLQSATYGIVKAPLAIARAPLRIRSVCLFVCLSVCLSVAKMRTQKPNLLKNYAV